MESANMEQKIKSIIRSLLISTPYKFTIRTLCKDFEDNIGNEIPFKKLGFDNVEQYLNSIPDTVYVVGKGYNAEVVGVASERSTHIDQMVRKQKKPASRRPLRKSIATYHRVQQHSSFNHVLSEPSTSRNRIPQLQPCIQSEYNSEIQLQEVDKSDDYYSTIPSQLKDNLRQLMGDFPNGINCNKLAIEYKKRYKHDINYAKYHYTSVLQMCGDLLDMFKLVINSNNEYIICDSNTNINKKDVNDKVDNVYEETSDLPQVGIPISKLDWKVASTFIPPNIIKIGEWIPRFFVDTENKIGDYLDICVAEIYDPSKFYIYCRNGGLDDLMLNIQTYYNSKKKQIIPEVLLDEGLFCVVTFEGEYHRAVIVDMLPNLPKEIRILYIDYGTVANVPSAEVFYLINDFCELPCQAMRARLSNIYPPIENTPWSLESKTRFRELIKYRALCAEITNIDRENKIIEIYLADITDETNITYINETLVKEGHALFTDQERRKSDFGQKYKPIVEYIHLYPTFLEIETGSVLNEAEYMYVIKKGWRIDQYYPHYFYQKTEKDTMHIQKKHEEFNNTRLKCTLPQRISVGILKTKFDFPLFPKTMLNDINKIIVEMKGGEYSNTRINDITDQNDSGNGFTQYSYNRGKRIADLIKTEEKRSNSKILNESNTIDNYKNKNINEVKTKSTNPFLDEEFLKTLSQNENLKLISNNPFLYDLNSSNCDDKECVNINTPQIEYSPHPDSLPSSYQPMQKYEQNNYNRTFITKPFPTNQCNFPFKASMPQRGAQITPPPGFAMRPEIHLQYQSQFTDVGRPNFELRNWQNRPNYSGEVCNIQQYFTVFNCPVNHNHDINRTFNNTRHYFENGQKFWKK